MENFIKYCKGRGEGDIVEFGTLTGSTSEIMAKNCDNKIFTIDGWKGLPKSEKELPHNGVWNEGAFTGNKNEVENILGNYKNVTMIDSWINQLDTPKSYGIGKIIGANIDVDIYESTIDSLTWLDKCEWVDDEVIVRFDDWDHPCNGDSEMRRQVSLHNKAAYNDFLKSTGYTSESLFVSDYIAIFKLKRKRK
jgi:hypothetical protein